MSVLSISVRTVIFELALFNIVATVFVGLYLNLTGTKGSGLRLFVAAKLFQGLSWAARLVYHLGGGTWADGFADFFLLLGFALEAALFMSFKSAFIGAGRRIFVGLSLLAALTVLALRGFRPELKDLVVLLSFLAYMGLIAAALGRGRGGSRFQRLLCLFYALFPLSTTLLYVLSYPEIAVDGLPTTWLGLAYYCIIVSMQIIGSFGYLLLVKERDELALSEIACRDSLTGILNRRAFFERAEALLSTSARSREPLSLVLMDLDLFKQLNDSHGHQAGDRAIRLFCNTVSAAIRRGDIFARHGGEEFAILLPGASREEALVVVSRIRESLAGSGFFLEGPLPRFTASIGVVTGVPERDEDLDRFIAASDAALYASKGAGRDRAAWIPLGADAGTAAIVLGPR